MSKAYLQHAYPAQVILEHDIAFNGASYLVIFGRHINGGFIAIPNWNVCTEASADGSAPYNAVKLTESGLDSETAQAIAEYIEEALKAQKGA